MEQYTLWKQMMISGEATTAWQKFYVRFYQAFLENNRWQQYLSGVGTTLLVTALALLIGVVLGIIVASVRTAHDQQRPNKRKPLLGLVNCILKV